MMTFDRALQWAQEQLTGRTERPRLEAEILLGFASGIARSRLLLHAAELLNNEPLFRLAVARRVAQEPIEYITGRVSFYDMELSIGPGALIPRPETEILVDKAAEIIRRYRLKYLAEIGIGSGAISIVLARMFPDVHIVATDISEAALSIAERNIAAAGLKGRITLRHTSLLDGIEAPIELMVSNPPYIALGTALPSSIADYEPSAALYADEEGDALLKKIIRLAVARGIAHVTCEMGYDQRARISAFVKELGVYSSQFYTDLAGLDRGCVLRSSPKKKGI